MFIGKFLHFISTSFRSHQHPVENKIANIQKHPVSLVNPEKPDVPLNKNDAFQKVQKRHVQEKR